MRILFTILAAFLLNIQIAVSQELYLLTNSAGQGEALTCFLYPVEGVTDTEFVLEDSSGKVLDMNPGFFYEPGNDYRVVVGIFGIASDALTGVGTLTVGFSTPQGREERSLLVNIAMQDFLVEIIPLDNTATGILSTPDPRKKEQAKKLWNILLTWNGKNQFSDSMFILPVEKHEESAWYGDRRTFKYTGGGTATTIHGGLDLAAKTGEPVLAPADGLVVMAEERIISGWTIVLEHLPGIFTMYYHMSRIDAADGQNVKQGQVLGLVGATGLVTGPHLHWEAKIHGISVDPKWFLTHPLIDKEAILITIESAVPKRR
jgi:hypothetical protein